MVDSKDPNPNPDPQPGPVPVPNTESVNIRLPTFWPNSIATWFIQVEAQFNIGRIASDVKKYNYVVSSLPQDIAESLMDILQNPPEIDMYKNLKETLIQRHSLSLEKRIRQLISDEEIGDRKPSDFYRHMKQLAGTTGTVGDDFIQKLWLSRLPNVINISLIPLADQGIDILLSNADKIHEALQNDKSVSSINDKSSKKSNNTDSSEISELRAEINTLKNMISNIRFNNDNSRSRSRTQSENKNRSNSNQRSNSRKRKFNARGSLCWYHFKFGDQATKCTSPCQRNASTSSTNDNQNSTN